MAQIIMFKHHNIKNLISIFIILILFFSCKQNLSESEIRISLNNWELISLEDAVEQNYDFLIAMKNSVGIAGGIYAKVLLNDAGLEEIHETIKIPIENFTNKNQSINEEQSIVNVRQIYDEVNIYPNPADDFVFVEYVLADFETFKSVNLYDIAGNLISTHPLTQAAGYLKLDVSNLASGNYIVSIGDKNGKYAKQIVIE